MSERNLGKIKFDWQPQFWTSCLRYWHDSAKGLLSNTIIFHIPAKNTDLNVFISQFLSPSITVHHNHCCIINNPSSVYMCELHLINSNLSGGHHVGIWKKFTSLLFYVSLRSSPSPLKASSPAGHAGWRMKWQGREQGFTYFHGANLEAILIRSECEECAGEGRFHPKTLQGTMKITALPG